MELIDSYHGPYIPVYVPSIATIAVVAEKRAEARLLRDSVVDLHLSGRRGLATLAARRAREIEDLLP